MNNENFIYGIHSVEALLNKHPQNIIEIFLQKDRKDKRAQKIATLAKENKVATHFISSRDFAELIGDARHQGVIAKIQSAKTYHENDLDDLLDDLKEPAFILILDGVQDPHNLGACLRSADAAGVHAVIAPKDNSVGLTPVVKKVASGAAESVPFIQVTNLARTIKQLQDRNIWVMGATEEAESSLYETDLKGALALVLGAEGAGMRRLTKEKCDILFNIPMSGSVASLNVSVATGVCLFEAVRQKILN